MTRFLSVALQAEEPQFRNGIRQLEAANGNPATDIRFSSEINQATQNKLRELGLDPHDTTGAELYHALQERIAADDARLTKYIRTQAAIHVSAEADVVAGMIQTIRELPMTKSCFALKASSLRALLKAQPPKKAMKRLGYRSVDSFLKHESPVLALAAAWLCEGEAWQKRLLSSYKTLRAHDFETRGIALIQPATERWKKLAREIVQDKRHTILCIKELGSIIFLPMSVNEVPQGAVSVSLSLALHEMNEIRACSTFLKLYQVRPEFGRVVSDVANDELRLSSKLLDQPLPWNLIHRYYARLKRTFNEAIFEPYVQLEEMNWHAIEQALAEIDPALTFWQDTAYLGLLDDAQKPVSMNFVDAALNYCNQLPFDRRIVHYFQHSLWQELLLKYLRQEPVEKAVQAEMQPQLVEEQVLA